MAMGWMTALKLVPWSDVIEAAPQIAQAARKLLRKSDKPALVVTAPDPGMSVQEQLDAQRQQLAQLHEEQRASAALIESLAQQNAQLVRALDELRGRYRQLALILGLLVILTLGLLGWAATH